MRWEAHIFGLLQSVIKTKVTYSETHTKPSLPDLHYNFNCQSLLLYKYIKLFKSPTITTKNALKKKIYSWSFSLVSGNIQQSVMNNGCMTQIQYGQVSRMKQTQMGGNLCSTFLVSFMPRSHEVQSSKIKTFCCVRDINVLQSTNVWYINY